MNIKEEGWTWLEKSLLIVGMFVICIGAAGQQLPAGFTTTTAVIKVVNFLGPAMNMAGAEVVHRKIIEDYLAGKFNRTFGYAVVEDSKITWNSLCYAEGNPTEWLVLQQLIVVKGEGDSVSISQITVGQDSTVDVLDDNYAVGGRGYGPAAIGVKSDGTKIESGLGTQTANTVLFVTQMKMFNMGATHEGQKTVRTYTLGQKNLRVTITATLNGTSTSSTSSVDVGMPKLSLDVAWGANFNQVTWLSISGDAPSFLYDLYQSTSPQGPWVGIGEISSTWRKITQGGTVPPYQFFKALSK